MNEVDVLAKLREVFWERIETLEQLAKQDEHAGAYATIQIQLAEMRFAYNAVLEYKV